MPAYGRGKEVFANLTTTLTDAAPSTLLFADNFDGENGGLGTLNYVGFANWNVTAGSVDLIGNGFSDFLPGHGLYIDLDGTSSAAGTLESKATFTLAPATYRLEFSLAGSQIGGFNPVIVRLGDVYSETFAPDNFEPFTTITRDIVVTSQTSGKIVFQHLGSDNVGTLLDEVRLLTDITDTRLFGMSPGRGGNTGSVTANIEGVNLPAGPASVTLHAEGRPDIVAVSANVVSHVRATATFDLTGAAPGLRDAVVTFSDGRSLTLEDAFTVETGSVPQLWVDIIGRTTIRPGRAQTFTVLYGNLGNVDAYGVPLWLGGVPHDVEVSLVSPVTPPPQQEGQPPTDWSQAPEFVETATGKLLPLFVPVVPPGSVGAVNIRLQSNAEQNFQLDAWATPSLVPSLVDVARQTTACGTAVSREILNVVGLIPGASCLQEVRGFIQDQYLGAVNDAVSAGQENRVLSLAELTVSFAAVAARCAGRELPVFTIWEVGQVIVGGLDVLADCQGLSRRLAEGSLPVTSVTSRDPNEKVGSAGAGAPRYLSGDEPLRYAVYFENVATATAPAQTVVVTDQLDASNMDFDTFSFGPITFGDRLLTPPRGVSDFSAEVDLRPGNNLVVRVNAHLDTGTGLLTYSFTSVDPETGQPPDDPLAGFLPPNVNAPEGEGSVVFTVMPKRGLPTGTEILNRATIVFDENAPLRTGEWLNTLDNTKPTSQVIPPAPNQCANFAVSWAGSDNGSGVLDYTVFVSENNGPYTVWQQDTVATSATFTGQPGKTYDFFSLARDRAGNVEEAPPFADASTTTANLISNAAVDKPTLWPPNHRMVDVTVSYDVAEHCDPWSRTICVLSVVSNEPANMTGDGNTGPDWQVADARRIRLRAERSGVGDGRLYTITITCTNSLGNSSVANAEVRVPRSRN